jgi:hypothetical protein
MRFDLGQRRTCVFDPIARSGEILLLVHRNCARHRLLFEIRRRENARTFPMSPVTIQRVIHCLGFGRAHSTATHRVIKHPVALFPRSAFLLISDIVKNRSVAIFSVKRPAHERPERARNRRAVDDRSSRRDPDRAIRVGVTQFAEQCHTPAIVFPARFDLSAVIAPRMFLPRCRDIPGRRLMQPAGGQKQEWYDQQKPFCNHSGKIAMRSACAGSGSAQGIATLSSHDLLDWKRRLPSR